VPGAYELLACTRLEKRSPKNKNHRKNHEQLNQRRLTLLIAGTPRCGVTARAAAGGTNHPASSNHVKSTAAFKGTDPTARRIS